MAQLTRKFLRALGVEEDKIDEIVTAHQDTLEEIKAERDSLKDNASKLAEAQAEVTRLSGELEKAKKNGGDAAKIQADFDAYKKQIADEKAAAQTDADVLALLKEAGIQRESFQQLASKSFDRSKIKRNEDGSISNRQELLDGIKTDFADCIATQQQQGTPPNNPPTGGVKGMTREQILAISDKAEQRAAIAQNLELFTHKN